MTAIKRSETLVPTLGGDWYADPSIFQREQAAIFSMHWVCTARSAELAEPGSFQVFEVGAESLIIVRDLELAVRAFYNVCRHRGSRICLEEKGQVGRTFQCPYHVWSYGLDGRLMGAPNLSSMPDLETSQRGLIPIAVREWLGYVWVCLSSEPPDFESSIVQQVTERFGDASMIGRYALEDLSVGRRIEYDVKANWKLIVENFAECYHCANLHPELVSVLPEFRRGYATQDKVGYGAEFAPDVKGFTYDGRPGFAPLAGLEPAQDRHYYGMTVMPQVVINLAPDHVIFHRMYPVTADRTIVRCDWLFAAEVVRTGQDVGPSVELFHRVNQQDFRAVEGCQPAMSSRVYREGGVFVPAEHHIRIFNDWVREQLASGSAG